MPEDQSDNLIAFAELATEAGNRIKQMTEAGRSWEGDVENTMSGRVYKAFNNLDDALSRLVDEYADAALSTGPQKGPYFRRKLAAAVKAGEFDKEEE